jgi:hypothetical protein
LTRRPIRGKFNNFKMINGFYLDKSRELDFYGLNEPPAPLFLAF